tara:strand:- start:4108 stop:4506 length:399 start_codon:yes stop_codon:yes gene_type:complete
MLEGPAAAARAGFGYVGMQFPCYLDLEDLNTRLAGNGLKLQVLNLPAGDPPQRSKGYANMPKKTRRILRSLGALSAFCQNSVPSQHEPGSGTMNFCAIFTAIGAAEYDGFVAAEYPPAGNSEHGLRWLQTYA